MADKRRTYGEGSIYQAKDGRYVGALEAGLTAAGTRRRVVVYGRSPTEVRRKLRDRRAAIDRGESGVSARATVKSWAETWLATKETTLRPQGFRAARSPVRRYIVPTIGHRKLAQLTPADVRAVQTAVRAAGMSAATAAGAHRTLLNMLRAAVAEGHTVPQRVLATKGVTVPRSDRQPLTAAEAVAALRVAADLPHGSRWLFALLYGLRQGECLGLTWEAVDLDAGTVEVAWQLQRVPYVDRARGARGGFRLPTDSDAIHLTKTWHLLRPKTNAGARVIPLLPQVVDSLAAWRDEAPTNPWGLVWPAANGNPAAHAADLEEWHAIQGTAGIGHPAGRYYHVHECRNVTATELRNTGADELVVTSLLGHTDIETSRGYMRVDLDPKREALARVAGVLGLPVTP